MQKNTIPLRREVDEKNRWDLSKLYKNDEAWYEALAGYEKQIDKVAAFKGTLGDSAQALAAFLDCEHEIKLLEEQLGRYAELRQCEDEGDDAARAMTGRFIILAARSAAEASWGPSEIQAIADDKMARFLEADCLACYRVYLHKLLRWKPHILSENEERLIALHSEAGGIVGEAFSVLTNVDFDFGQIDTPEGRLPLTQSTFSVFLEYKDRGLRERAWRQFYGEFSAHKTTLAALYAGQVKQDVIHARIRGFGSAREAALFGDDVPLSTYDNLIATITENLAPLHRYYDLRRRALKLKALGPWDMHTALVPCAEKTTSWEEAAALVIEALAPLGGEYGSVLEAGLAGRWADRYENKGKRSGAFSAGGFTADPYILMNYKSDSIRDIFTLAHEAGHSMHSWYSARSNPFPHYSYTIFEAEVA
ncbi:MAG: oligoendopeptidase F family protein, partial [Spirochaetaceae bacterium]|nr:oligoendopeptidase F family protein [Spirochaetaceae bacterium]